MLSTCMQGQTGPRRLYRGFGNLMAGLAGFYELTGWPDRTPAMIYGAYTDFVSQRFTATALLAALDHRRRTGEGQHIDLSQLEASLQFLGPELLAYELDGRVATRAGNRDRDLVPNGVFPCLAGARPRRPLPRRRQRRRGVGGDQLRRRRASGRRSPALAGLPDEPRWRTADGRRRRRGPHRGAARGVDGDPPGRRHRRRCCSPHVASAAVLGVPELHTDPQVAHRGYWVPLEHPVYGAVPYSGMQAVLSRTPGNGARPGALPRPGHLVRAGDDPRGRRRRRSPSSWPTSVAEITG